MVTVTDSTRDAIWGFICDQDMEIRYLSKKGDQVQHRFWMLRFGMLSSVLIEGLLMWFTLSQPWGLAIVIPFGVVMVILAVWDTLSNHAYNAALLRCVVSDGHRLRGEMVSLWLKVESYQVDEQEAEAQSQSTRDQWERVKDRVVVKEDNKLIEQCARESTALIEAQGLV